MSCENNRAHVLLSCILLTSFFFLLLLFFPSYPLISPPPSFISLNPSSIMVPTEGLIFASLVAFLLGMFASSTFTRWWSCREKLSMYLPFSPLLSLFPSLSPSLFLLPLFLYLATIMNHSMMITVILESFCISREPQVLLLFERIKRYEREERRGRRG